MSPETSERPFFVSKDFLDTVNSVSWFFMDASWMLGAHLVGYVMIAPTILTGLALLYIEKRRNVLCINLSINCWIWMNTLWMLSDMLKEPNVMIAARVCFGLGAAFILLAIRYSDNLKETFSHFRRFRVLKW